MVNYSLIAGSNTTLTCTVTGYSISGLSVEINITWFSNEKAILTDNEMISESNMPQTFISQLTLSPLKLEDENVTCSATAHLLSPQANIDRSSTASRALDLNIEGSYIYKS